MTRWLVAARQAKSVGTKATKPTEPHSAEVLSVLSVMSDGLIAEAIASLSWPG